MDRFVFLTFDGLSRGAVYAAFAMDGLGVIPLRGARRRERLDLLRGIAADADAKVALVGIDAAAVRAAATRQWLPDDQPATVDDAGSVFSDGVLLTWDVDTITL